ncbi:MAG: hypothetical protein J6B34_01605 [Clostridia bacterium]|nr:hypothetical protein [Clostridia bacterium]
MKFKSVKRIFCIVLALMLLLPAMSLSSFAQDSNVTEPLAIINEPKAHRPTAVVNDATGVSYQWYTYEYSREEITDQNAHGYMENGYTENGWIPATLSEEAIYFDIYLDPGDVVVLPVVNDVISYYLYSSETGYVYPILENNELVFHISTEEIYFLGAYGQGEAIRAYKESSRVKAVEGQTEATLTEYEIGREYFVQASRGEDVVDSATFKMIYTVAQHPTQENPSITVNKGNADSYEWYYVGKDGASYKVVLDDSSISAHIYSGEYNDGMWFSESGYINLEIYALEGDTLKIEVGAGAEHSAGLYDSDRFEIFEDGAYLYKFEEDGRLDFDIKAQGSIEDVEINIERDGRIIPVVPETFIYEDVMELVPSSIGYGYYENDWWRADGNGQIELHFIIDRDDVAFKIEGADNLDITVLDNDYELVEKNENGLYDTGKGSGLIHIEQCGMDTKIKISLVDGEKEYKVVEMPRLYDEEGKRLEVWYVNDGVCKEGKWYPSKINNEIDIELALEKGYILEIVTSESFDGEVTLDISNASGLEIDLEKTDGRYLFVAGKYIEFDLELEKCENEFFAEIRVIKGECQLLENQISSKAELDKLGYYFVNVNMENGDKVISRGFEFNNCHHTYNKNQPKCDTEVNCSSCNGTIEAMGHSYSDWTVTKYSETGISGTETRACLLCGDIEEREIPALERNGADVAVIFIIMGSGLGAGAIVALGAWLIIKKKSLGK